MKPIYIPSGKAKEYGDYALNIYTGCPHRCYYCFSPSVLRRDREVFHSCIQPREGIIEATKKQINDEEISGKTIFLCFSCDAYPKNCDASTTREIIGILKSAGNHVKILTKNGADAILDFDLLDKDDWFGISYAGYSGDTSDIDYIPKEEPDSDSPANRLTALAVAHTLGIKTWVSFEPVLNPEDVLEIIKKTRYADMRKIGKLNYYPSVIDWSEFGKATERKCLELGLDYYIKESLRVCMGNDGKGTLCQSV